MSQKKFTLYYSDLSLHSSPALVIAEEDAYQATGPCGPWVFYLREGKSDGQINLRVWGRDRADEVESDVAAIRAQLSLDKASVILTVNKELNASLPETPFVKMLFSQVKSGKLWDSHKHVTNSSTYADFWKTHLPEETRPGRHRHADGFTFNALKLMWKAFNKSGFSNKSKADLFEGFAETAVEAASTDAGEAFIASLPKRMIVVEGVRRAASDPSDIKQPERLVSLISRVSAGSLYAADSSPNIDEGNISGSYQFIDLKDPYTEPFGNSTASEAEAMEKLKGLYVSMEK